MSQRGGCQELQEESERQRRRDSSPLPVQGSLEKSSQVNTGERQVDGVGHAAT